MAQIKVNPNRMELAKLTKRLKIAKKGHKLMKDKQEQLVRHFLDIVKENMSLRDVVEEELRQAYQSFLLVKNFMGEEQVEEAILTPPLRAQIEFGERSILNLKTPTFRVNMSGEGMCYGPLGSSAILDRSVQFFSDVFKKLLSLAENEKTLVELAKEIISTRRRVNALEYVLIADIERAIKEIKGKLSEMERAATVQLMFVK